jgi:hypothetical protein
MRRTTCGNDREDDEAHLVYEAIAVHMPLLGSRSVSLLDCLSSGQQGSNPCTSSYLIYAKLFTVC